jgi:hypothetical protein
MAESALDRLKEDLAAFIRWVMRDATYLGQYVCTVQGQDADGLLQLLPDEEKVRGDGLGAVKIKVGLPGFEVKVPVGARVLLGWEDGNPKKPYAALFDPSSVTSIAFADGTQAVARQGDLVIAGGTGLVVTFMPPPPAPPVGATPNNAMVVGVPYLISFSAVAPAPPLYEQQPLYGAIATGRLEFTS